ncbi:hypothetical protein [Shimazuella alba]|uniref:Uncharacterized protein n=1 Tax=Shimazuella alba TaxID=2690964 RepID=A0A6I4VX93_9BACL|nr:hypothetical protein [Shimazuella alba]MXQ55198.1 hypothetical protein [Shimazuella alba]
MSSFLSKIISYFFDTISYLIISMYNGFLQGVVNPKEYPVQTIKLSYSDCVEGGYEDKEVKATEGDRKLFVHAWMSDPAYTHVRPGEDAHANVCYHPTGIDSDGSVIQDSQDFPCAEGLQVEQVGYKPWTWTSPCGSFRLVFEVK